MIALIIGLAIGLGIPLQTSINSRLRSVSGSPFVSSLLSFAVGTIFLAVLTISLRHSLLLPQGFVASQPWWMWCGGILGVVYLTSNILLFPHIGSVQTVIFPILGQVLMGLAIDHFGLFDSAVSLLTPQRGAGAILVLTGVTICVVLPDVMKRHHTAEDANRSESDITKPVIIANTSTRHHSAWHWRLLGIIAGMLSACQTAINGRLGVELDSVYEAAFISFVTGTLVLTVIVILQHPHLTFAEKKEDHTWWMWLGGFIGAGFVAGNAYLAPVIGTGLAVVIVLIGLMTGSLLVDQFGLLGAKKTAITPLQILGLIVMIAGVSVIRLLA